MGSDPKLEQYLSAMEQVLKPFSAGDRAEIVTEIKSHVLSALEKDSTQSIESILNALGAPETVANRYLLERGLKPTRPPISPVVKWLVIGFLGTLGIFLLFSVVLFWKFSPVLRISGKDDRVTLFGGLIDIDGKRDTVQVGSLWLSGGIEEKNVLTGSMPFVPSNQKDIEITYQAGKVEVLAIDENRVEWECRVPTSENASLMEKQGKWSLDLNPFPTVHCTVRVPKQARVLLHKGNEAVVVHGPSDKSENKPENKKEE